ncbi:hypothetical protein MKX01_022624, partial [Papaver californicum]
GNEIHYVYMEGYVFSGDTAQTVARGIDFRFEDIRSLFYNEFILESETNRNRISETFHLNQNFRTHAGFLKLSQSVLDLLYHYFSFCVDKLSAETNLITGEAPVLLEAENQGNPILTIFDNGVDVSGSIIGDDSSKKEICSHIGKKALILTIVESKGLESQDDILITIFFLDLSRLVAGFDICDIFFDFVTNFLICMHDVLLYNFFGTSPLKRNWRLVYGYMKEKNPLDSTNIDSFPCFSEGKHKILCSELRQLYVAITRTKQILWVYENIGEFSNPIYDYWKKLQVVQVKTLDESLAHEMRVTSSNTDWSLRGIKLFNEGNFEMTALCFQGSGDSFNKKWAKAAGLRASADSMWGSKSESAPIGKFELAAKCLILSLEYKRAGMRYRLFSHQNSKVFISTSTFI